MSVNNNTFSIVSRARMATCCFLLSGVAFIPVNAAGSEATVRADQDDLWDHGEPGQLSARETNGNPDQISVLQIQR